MSEMLRRVAMMMKKAPTFATWNPADKGSNVTLSGGNNVASIGADVDGSVRATIGKSSGKWYWEVTLSEADFWFVGAGLASKNLATYMSNPDCIGAQSNGYYWNSAGQTNWGVTFGAGNIIGLALDLDSGILKFYVNNALQGNLTNIPSGVIYPMVGGTVGGPCTFTTNFGATAFAYTPPGGFNAGVY